MDEGRKILYHKDINGEKITTQLKSCKIVDDVHLECGSGGVSLNVPYQPTSRAVICACNLVFCIRSCLTSFCISVFCSAACTIISCLVATSGGAGGSIAVVADRSWAPEAASVGPLDSSQLSALLVESAADKELCFDGSGLFLAAVGAGAGAERAGFLPEEVSVDCTHSASFIVV